MKHLLRTRKEKVQLPRGIQTKILMTGLLADFFNIHGFRYSRTEHKLYEIGKIYIMWFIDRKCRVCGLEYGCCRFWGLSKETNKCYFCRIEDIKTRIAYLPGLNKLLREQGSPEIELK